MPHRKRERFDGMHAIFVTTRLAPHVWNLREPASHALLNRIFEKARDRFNTRIIYFVLPGNHLHLIAESTDNFMLSRAMKGLGVRIGKNMNGLMGRHGKVIDHRYHSSIIQTTEGARHVVRYVRENFRKHFGKENEWREGVTIDPCSWWAGAVELPKPETEVLMAVDPFS